MKKFIIKNVLSYSPIVSLENVNYDSEEDMRLVNAWLKDITNGAWACSRMTKAVGIDFRKIHSSNYCVEAVMQVMGIYKITVFEIKETKKIVEIE